MWVTTKDFSISNFLGGKTGKKPYFDTCNEAEKRPCKNTTFSSLQMCKSWRKKTETTLLFLVFLLSEPLLEVVPNQINSIAFYKACELFLYVKPGAIFDLFRGYESFKSL